MESDPEAMNQRMHDLVSEADFVERRRRNRQQIALGQPVNLHRHCSYKEGVGERMDYEVTKARDAKNKEWLRKKVGALEDENWEMLCGPDIKHIKYGNAELVRQGVWGGGS